MLSLISARIYSHILYLTASSFLNTRCPGWNPYILTLMFEILTKQPKRCVNWVSKINTNINTIQLK